MSLRKTLKLRDLVYLNIASVVGLSSLAQVAQFGYGSLLLFAVAAVTFLVPCGVMVAELNAYARGGRFLSLDQGCVG